MSNIDADFFYSFLTIKGAPDILIERCSQVLCPDGELRPLSDGDLAAIKSLKDQWSSKGKRVILLARKLVTQGSISADPSFSDFESHMLREAGKGLVLVGMVGLIDPPRTEIPEVIRILRQAQIRVFMVCVLFEGIQVQY
jgi:sodium/potassium-transporting ATPase subunit alpha